MASNQRSVESACRGRSDARSSSRVSDAATERMERELTVGGEDGGAEALLELLTDSFVQRILAAIDEEARPARELVEMCDGSRPTVYRKLNRLEDRGLVVTDIEVHQDGHHRKMFESTFEQATVELVDGTPQVRLVLTGGQRNPEEAGVLPGKRLAD